MGSRLILTTFVPHNTSRGRCPLRPMLPHFLNLPPEIRRIIYHYVLHHDVPLTKSSKGLDLSLLRTCRLIQEEGREVFYQYNIVMLRVLIKVDDDQWLTAQSCPSNFDEEMIKRFRNFKIVIVCDGTDDVFAAQSCVKDICCWLRKIVLRSLEISVDRRLHSRKGRYQDSFMHEEWESNYPDGISKALQPFSQLRCQAVKIHGLPHDYEEHLLKKIRSNEPPFSCDMLDRALVCMPDTKNVKRKLQDAAAADDLDCFKSIRSGYLEVIKQGIDNVHKDDPPQSVT